MAIRDVTAAEEAAIVAEITERMAEPSFWNQPQEDRWREIYEMGRRRGLEAASAVVEAVAGKGKRKN